MKKLKKIISYAIDKCFVNDLELIQNEMEWAISHRLASDHLTSGEFIMTPIRRPVAWMCQETGSWWHSIPRINGAVPRCSCGWPADAGEP